MRSLSGLSCSSSPTMPASIGYSMIRVEVPGIELKCMLGWAIVTLEDFLLPYKKLLLVVLPLKGFCDTRSEVYIYWETVLPPIPQLLSFFFDLVVFFA